MTQLFKIETKLVFCNICKKAFEMPVVIYDTYEDKTKIMCKKCEMWWY